MVNKRDRLLHGRGVNERHGNDLRQYRVSVRRKRSAQLPEAASCFYQYCAETLPEKNC